MPTRPRRRETPRVVLPALLLCLFAAALSVAGAESDQPASLDPPPGCPLMRITVVYNAFVWPDNDWRFLIGSQLEHLNRTGLPACAPVHVALSAPAQHGNMTHEELAQILVDARELVLSSVPPRREGQRHGAVVSVVHENAYEYPGIHLVWLLAQQLDQAEACKHVFLYFHSKGMVFHGPLRERAPKELELFESTVVPWRQIADTFAVARSVTRLGAHPTYRGFLFHNFWWARASYLQTVDRPVRQLGADQRYYFEGWLAQSPWRAHCRTCFRWEGRVPEGYGSVSDPQHVAFFQRACPLRDITTGRIVRRRAHLAKGFQAHLDARPPPANGTT